MGVVQNTAAGRPEGLGLGVFAAQGSAARHVVRLFFHGGFKKNLGDGQRIEQKDARDLDGSQNSHGEWKMLPGSLSSIAISSRVWVLGLGSCSVLEKKWHSGSFPGAIHDPIRFHGTQLPSEQAAQMGSHHLPARRFAPYYSYYSLPSSVTSTPEYTHMKVDRKHVPL